MKIERLLGIILYLMNRDCVSANQLAQHFEVSKRTILRDIDTLTLAGIPIYAQTGRDGGYILNKNYKLNEKIMDDENTEYLFLALSSLKSIYGNAKMIDTYEKVKHIYARKAATTLPDIDFSVIKENEHVNDALEILKQAIQGKQIVSFMYTNNHGLQRLVNANIIHTYYRWYAWYTLAFDHDKNDYRFFKVVRMQDIKISEHLYEQDYDVVAILQSYDRATQADKLILTLRYANKMNPLVNEYFKGEIIEETEERMIRKITIKTYDFMSFSLLLGFGDKIEIISPLSYKQKICDHIQNILQLYHNGDR